MAEPTDIKDLNKKFPILVVEDNQVTRMLLERYLTKENYEVVAAENGQQALSLFTEKNFRIVLTDWMMPEMNGVDLCREIRKKSTDGYVFIVILTAKDSHEDIISGLKAGADDYLTKPINHAELIARLNTGRRILGLETSLRDALSNVKQLYITDPLTNCYNRAYLMENLPNEIKRSRRYKRNLSVIFTDIDHFKKINDSFGHQVGDRILVEFSQCIYNTIRIDIDRLIRFGGEEFLIVLPETDLDGACVTAERIRKEISELVVKVHDNEIQITASFGITGFTPDTPNEDISVDEMIKFADKLMYQSKEEGRDGVTSKMM